MSSHLTQVLYKSSPSPLQDNLQAWRTVQTLLLVAGFGLVAALIWSPALGLNLLWNGLIPAAPALVVIAPGLWRNICPLATFSLLPRRLGLSRRQPLSRGTASLLALAGLVALYAIVPLRHLSLNTDGHASALMLVVAALLALLLGVRYDWRGAWCNSLCPIHPVEKLYGQAPALSFTNARCDHCCQCSTPCPDSTRGMHPLVTDPNRLSRALGHILTGSFVGFVWGWYRIPDYTGAISTGDAVAAFAWPLGAGLASLSLYGIVWRTLCHSTAERRLLVRIFAAAAVSTYYWFRIPALTGFGPHPGSGMLIDLSADWPLLPWLSRTITTGFFAWFLLWRQDPGFGWTRRPARV